MVFYERTPLYNLKTPDVQTASRALLLYVKLGHMSKLLGIDYGEKNVGLAVSNEDETLAFPRDVLRNDKNLMPTIKELCKNEGIASIVMGESRNYQGSENPIMNQIKMFQAALSRETSLPVYLEPEFLTSVEASRLQGATPHLDAAAAALILKSFLARRANKKL